MRRRHHELADFLRVPRRGEERDPAAERVAHEVRLLQPQVVDEGRGVVGHESDVDRPVDVGGTAVPLEVGPDDLMALGESGDDRLEHLARAEPAVDQDDRSPGPVGLVVEAESVDLRVLAGGLRIASCGRTLLFHSPTRLPGVTLKNKPLVGSIL